MPKLNEKVTFEPLLVGGKQIGFRMVSTLMFEDFKAEVQGREWSLPLLARGNPNTGELAGQVVDGKWVMPEDYKTHKTLVLDNQRLYVLETGEVTPNPYIDGTNKLAPGVLSDEREATPHRDVNFSITPEGLLWPDGKIRKLRVSLKANTPQTMDEFTAKKQQQRQRLQQTTIKGTKTREELDEIIRLATERRAQLAGAL